ncbi:DUF1492 domain-containing protein [Tissierella creatinophila]|uniref:DUF1492 domain-containing protein n=1 Tax=Tissierella creatinophila DSM 6911 TaxID=1123403 RepID=A0A1U7M5W4_TISCR|nr:DUF1492 domain-containing protein [Tissierella creatinophila]OLS02578.1 hypothetical protein TICRE_13790 [Tissierella creatinophila DSM 6911]
MTAKEYLSQVYWLNKMVNNKLEQKEELEAMAERTTIDFTKEKVSGGSGVISPMEDAAVKLIDLSHQINDDIDELINLKKEIAATIKKVGDYRYRTILEMRYLKGKLWDDVSGDIGFDKRWVMKLHSRALKEIDEILKLTTKRHL